MKNLLRVAWIVLAVTSPAMAGDVYLFQAHAEGPPIYNPDANAPEIVEWSTDAFFFNQGMTDAVVKVLDDANGDTQFTIPPQHAVSLSNALPHRLFRFVHAIVPDSVAVENALFIGEVPISILPIAPEYRFGKVTLPVFTALTAANQPQVHLATFLGSQQSHANVWVYNGGDSAATAHIEIHRQCDDAVVDTTTVTVASKNALVVPGMASTFGGCIVTPEMQPWMASATYAVVTVDQPSLSFVSVVASGQIPKAMVSVN